jgi:hypothetical protein
LLQLLGRTAEARQLIRQLDAAGYRDPAFLMWAGPGADRGASPATTGDR